MEKSHKWTKRSGKWLAGAALLTATGAAGAGCLARPVGTQPPTTKVNFTSTVSQQQVDKVDLLFMIDNSASMGDKQAILADAVPNLLVGLLQPKCVDPATGNAAPGAQDRRPEGQQGQQLRLPMRHRARVLARHRHAHRHHLVVARKLRRRRLCRRRSPERPRAPPQPRRRRRPAPRGFARQLPLLVSAERREHRQDPPPRSADHALRRRADALGGVREARHRRRADRLRSRGPDGELVPLPRPARPVGEDHRRRKQQGRPRRPRRRRRRSARAARRLPPSRLARRRHPPHRRGRLVGRPALGRRPGLGLHGEPVPGLAELPRRRQDHDRAARNQRVRQGPGLARLHLLRLRGDVQRRPTRPARRSRTTRSA